MRKEIKRITIKSSSGYCCVEDAYNDKLSITADSITYEYKPYLETEMNPAVKWSYRTNSKNFQTLFSEILKDTDSVLEYIDTSFLCDVGTYVFIVTYSDKSRRTTEFSCPNEEINAYFMRIRELVPQCEDIPSVLKTSEDYE